MVKKKRQKFVLPPGVELPPSLGTKLKPKVAMRIAEADKPIRVSLNQATVSAVRNLLEKRRYYDTDISKIIQCLSQDPLARELFGLKPVSEYSVSYRRRNMGLKESSKKGRSGRKIDTITHRMIQNLVWSGRYSPKKVVEIMEGLNRPVSHMTVRRLMEKKPAKELYLLKLVRKEVYRNPEMLYRILKKMKPPQCLELLEKLVPIRVGIIRGLNLAKSKDAIKIYAETLQDINAVLKTLSSFLSKEFFEEKGIDVKNL